MMRNVALGAVLGFVIVVLFFRGGVVEAWVRFWAWRAARRPAAMQTDAPR